MDILISGQHRAHLRTDLLSHRARYSLNDADYVRSILRISLNTFKKCIGPGDSLSIKQRTFNNLIGNAGLDPQRIGAKDLIAPPPMEHGGYTKSEFGYLVGRYLLYRRSFQNGQDISRAVLDITWNESQSCLSFAEMRRYKTDGGQWQANDLTGNIYMHAERVLMGLLCIDKGDVRLTLLHIPSRHVYGTTMGTVRTSGVVLTHGYPKRYFQPVVSAVTLEAIGPSHKSLSPNQLCVTFTPGMPEYAEADEELRIAEEHAVVMTPLMRRSQAFSSKMSI